MKTFSACALLLVSALAPGQTFAYYPDDNTGGSYAAPAGWYPWFTNITGSRLQIFVPASAFSSVNGLVNSIGGFLGNSLPVGNASVTFANFTVKIGPAGVPALTNTFDTNLPPANATLVVNAPGLTLPVNPAGGWQDVAFLAPYALPGGNLVIDFESSIPSGGAYFHSSVSSLVPRCVAATYTGQATGTLSATSGTKIRLGYTPENVLIATTSGSGAGDLSLSLTLINPLATEGFLLITDAPIGPPNSGPMFGIWPSAITWNILTSPAAPGNPLHFTVGPVGIFPDTPINAPAPTLAFLAGQTWDVVALLLGPGYLYVGRSVASRIVW